MKKTVSLFLAIALFLTLGGGVQGARAEGYEDTLRFTAYLSRQGDESYPFTEWPSYQAMLAACEEYMGMNIEIEYSLLALSEYLDRLTIYVASGDLHDVFTTYGKEMLVRDLADSGQIVNLLEYEALIGNLLSRLEDNYGLQRALYQDGLWGAPYLQHSSTNGSQAVWMVRADTLEQHGLTVPDTLDEMYELLVQLKALYPDSYPMESYSAPRGYGIPRVIMHCYCVDDGLYYDGEKYVYGPFDQEARFRSAIEYVRKLYAEGLLQPEFFTQTADALPMKAMSDKTFMIPNIYTAQINRNYVSAEHPEIRWGIMPLPAGIEGEKPWKTGANKIGYSYQYNSLVINSNAEDIDLLVKLVDYQYSDEIIEISNWGIEGESYTVGDNGENVWSDDLLSLHGADRFKKSAEWGVMGSGYGYPNVLTCWTLDWDARGSLWESVPAWDGEAFTYPENVVAYYDGSGSIPLPGDGAPLIDMTDEEGEFISTVQGAANTVMEEGMIKLITGTMSMDDWDQYIESIRAVGDMDAVLAIYNGYLDALE